MRWTDHIILSKSASNFKPGSKHAMMFCECALIMADISVWQICKQQSACEYAATTPHININPSIKWWCEITWKFHTVSWSSTSVVTVVTITCKIISNSGVMGKQWLSEVFCLSARESKNTFPGLGFPTSHQIQFNFHHKLEAVTQWFKVRSQGFRSPCCLLFGQCCCYTITTNFTPAVYTFGLADRASSGGFPFGKLSASVASRAHSYPSDTL